MFNFVNKSNSTRQGGFTLIELLIVIGVLAILMAIVLVAVNPAKQFAESNNTQRRSDVKAILDAVGNYAVTNKGVLPDAADITTTTKPIGSGSGKVDLCADLVPTIVADLPSDPSTGTRTPAGGLCTGASSYDTGYMIKKSATDNRITIEAPGAENGATISITR